MIFLDIVLPWSVHRLTNMDFTLANSSVPSFLIVNYYDIKVFLLKIPLYQCFSCL